MVKEMTIEEAIQHCHEVADKECTECGKEHLQLAEWLTELKQRRDAEINMLQKCGTGKAANTAKEDHTQKSLSQLLREQ